MSEWFDFILTKIKTAFREFPELKYWAAFYLVLVILSVCLYVPILQWAYDFNYFGAYPLQSLIAENASWLVLGKYIIPPILALFCYWDLSERHDKKYVKRNGQLPKWVR